MTIKEKARAYDKALEIAKKNYATAQDLCEGSQIGLEYFKNTLKSIFPELKESKDEKIRKEIIEYFEICNIKHLDWIAWLEKQGEQKPTTNKYNVGATIYYNSFGEIKSMIVANVVDIGDGNPMYEDADGNDVFEKDLILQMHVENQKPADKVEPKFKEGEWIVFNGLTLYVKEVVKSFYRTVSKGGIPNSYDWDIDNVARLWTIQDAKAGDVLISKYGKPFIYNGNFDSFNIGSYCGITTEGVFNVATEKCYWTGNVNIHPATKEQRDLLFQKIKEAGYVWDAEKKELRKIEQKPTDKIEPKFKVGDKIQYLKGCGTIMTIEKIENGEYIFGNNLGHTTIEDGNKWYLVERNTTWSEEDEKMFRSLHNLIYVVRNCDCDSKEKKELSDWFKSLKDRVLPQPKQEWSEEDEQYLLVCKNALSKYQISDKWDASIVSRWLEKRLKSPNSKPKKRVE